MRGKIWIISGHYFGFRGKTFEMKGDWGLVSSEGDRGKYYLQNKYQISWRKYPVSQKWKDVFYTAFEQENRPDRMKFNFMSATGTALGFLRWLPRNVAFDPSGPNSMMSNNSNQNQIKELEGYDNGLPRHQVSRIHHQNQL